MLVRCAWALLFTFSICGKTNNCAAQNADSLYRIFKNLKYHDTLRLSAIHTASEISLYDNPDTAIWFARLEFDFAENLKNKIWQVKALDNQANAYLVKNNIPKALEQNSKQLKIFRQSGDQKGIANTYFNMGEICKETKTKEALQYYEFALQIYMSINLLPRIADTHMSIGGIFERAGNYAEALKHFQNELRYCEQISDDYRLAKAYNDLGLIYYNLKEYLKALEFQKKALVIQQKLGDKEGIGFSYNNIGLNYLSLNKYEEALKNCRSALKIRIKIGDKLRIGYTLINIGKIYLNQAKYDLALENYFSASKALNEIKYKPGIADAYSGISKVYLLIDNYKEAEHYASLCRNLALESGPLEALREASQILSETYEKTNRPAEALKFHKAYIAIRDSIFNEANTKKFIQTEMNFEFEKKEAIGRAEQDKLNVLQEEQNKRHKNVIAFTSIGLLLVIAFSVFIFSRYKITERQKIIIEKQKHEVDKQRELADSRRIIAEEQREIIELQKQEVDKAYEKLTEKNKEVMDSIRYASRIQKALLTTEKYIGNQLNRFLN